MFSFFFSGEFYKSGDKSHVFKRMLALLKLITMELYYLIVLQCYLDLKSTQSHYFGDKWGHYNFNDEYSSFAQAVHNTANILICTNQEIKSVQD